MTQFVQPALAAYAAGSQRKFVDRTRTVGASEIGRCERAIWYRKNNAPTNNAASDWGPATRGSVIEASFWEPALRERFGERLLFSGDDQRSFIQGELSATPDALLTGITEEEAATLGIPSGGSVLLECKTCDPRVAIAEPKPHHIMQVQAQLGVVRETSNHKPAYAIISYINASSWSDVVEFVVTFDPAVFASAKQRARRILQATAAVELQPIGYIDGGRECQHCPYSRVCGLLRAPPAGDDHNIDPGVVAEVSALAKQIIDLDKVADAAAHTVRAQKEVLRDRLRSLGVRRVIGDGISVIWSSVKGRTVVDVEAMREAGIDTSKFEREGAPSDRLSIKPTQELKNDKHV